MSKWQRPEALSGQLRELYGLTAAPVWGMPRNLERKTLGGKVTKVLTTLGYPPLPWQRYVYDVALELNPDGSFAYRQIGLSVMRQQGKTIGMYGLLTWRAMAMPNQLIVYTAQDRNYARQRLEEELWPIIERSPFGKYWRPRWTNGSEALIYRKNYSRIRITANTESAGHGPPLDLGAMDEVFALKDDRLEQAFSPAMLTRERYGQLWWASNAGDEKSTWLNSKRVAGRLVTENYWTYGVQPRFAYFEWSLPHGMSRSDQEAWLDIMPGMCPNPPCKCDPDGLWHHTCTAETIRAELESMAEDPGAFDRAYLNLTRKAVPLSDPNIPKVEWSKSVDVESQIVGDLSFAVEVNTSRDHASISAVGKREDGRWHVELVTRRSGTDWVIWAMQRLTKLHNPVCWAVDDRGPAGSLIPDMERAGFTKPDDQNKPHYGQLYILNTTEAIKATGQMVDDIRSDSVRHLDQPSLTGAINSAVTRPVGDSWLFGRKLSGADIAPFVAATHGRYAHEQRSAKVSPEDYDLAASVL